MRTVITMTTVSTIALRRRKTRIGKWARRQYKDDEDIGWRMIVATQIRISVQMRIAAKMRVSLKRDHVEGMKIRMT